MDLRGAIRSGQVGNIDTALLRSGVRHELMAKNAADGAGGSADDVMALHCDVWRLCLQSTAGPQHEESFGWVLCF